MIVLNEIKDTAWSVLTAVLPLAVLFLLFQIFLLQLPRKGAAHILIGTLLAAAGLFLFLLGVGIGFLPFGRAIGEALGALPQTWLFLPVGLFLGFVTTWSEPAVRILANQVEQASNGAISRTMVLIPVCIGVAISVAAGLFRIGYEIPLLAMLVPGYLVAFALLWASKTEFVAIAVDAGGVATGPMANTFLLALALGVSASIAGQNSLVHGLGLVALIALAPIITVMALGLILRWKQRKTE